MLLNLAVAWVAVILAGICAIKYVVRLAAQRSGPRQQRWRQLNRCLGGSHRWLGWALIGTGLVHGLLSSQSVFSLNLGTLCWVCSVLLGVGWLLRARQSRRSDWVTYHRLLTAVFLISIVVHVINVGGIRIHRVIMGDDSVQMLSGQASTGDVAILRDGTYTGTAQGFRPGLTVSVVVKDNRIASVAVISHNEVNQRFYGRAMQVMPQRIVGQQSLAVDTVAGATRTSRGIIDATRSALRKALISGTLPGLNN